MFLDVGNYVYLDCLIHIIRYPQKSGGCWPIEEPVQPSRGQKSHLDFEFNSRFDARTDASNRELVTL